MTDMTIPSTLTAFRAWRQRQTFATPELANHARLVEADLNLLRSAGHLSSVVALAQKNVAAFAAEYAASQIR
jgi:hypothetical protein